MVLVQFVADTLFKTLVAVPIVGGLVLVALVVGGNPFELLRLDDLTQTVSTMVGVLLAQPVALAAFVVSMGVILTGGSILMFAIKAGSVTVLLAGDRSAGTIEVPPLRMSALRDANQATLERFTAGMRTLFSRYLRLGIALTVAYALIGGAYIAFLFGSTNSALDNPFAVTLASLSVLVAITLVNFIYLLLQIVIAATDCTVLEAVPKVLVDAIIATEDRTFYSHEGISIRGTLRALWLDIRTKSLAAGGSTLTQQLVKNLYLNPERTFRRKAREALMALLIEMRYSKEQILELYLNEIYLGQNGSVQIAGVEQA